MQEDGEGEVEKRNEKDYADDIPLRFPSLRPFSEHYTVCTCVCRSLSMCVKRRKNLPKLRGTQARTSLLKNIRQPITEGR